MLGLRRSEIDVIEFFDAQIEDGVSIDELVRHAAEHAGATVGVHFHDFWGVAMTPSGHKVSPIPPNTAAHSLLSQGGAVWLDREGRIALADCFFLRRLAVAVFALHRRFDAAPVPLVPPLHVLVDPGYAESVRDTYLRLLNVRPGETVRMLVGVGPDDSWRMFLVQFEESGCVVSHTDLDSKHIALVRNGSREILEVAGVPKGFRAAQSRPFPADTIPQAYADALKALRFTFPSQHDTGPYSSLQTPFVGGDRLGGFEVLCLLSREQINDVDDIRALDSLFEKYGQDILRVLEAYSSTESLRQAASLAYMHHNTVAYWVERAESVLGFELKGPYRRAQLFVSLCLYRVRSTLDD